MNHVSQFKDEHMETVTRTYRAFGSCILTNTGTSVHLFILIFPYSVLQVPDGAECVVDETSVREVVETDGEVYTVLQVKAYIHAPDLRPQWYLQYHDVYEAITEGIKLPVQ